MTFTSSIEPHSDACDKDKELVYANYLHKFKCS